MQSLASVEDLALKKGKQMNQKACALDAKIGKVEVKGGSTSRIGAYRSSNDSGPPLFGQLSHSFPCQLQRRHFWHW